MPHMDRREFLATSIGAAAIGAGAGIGGAAALAKSAFASTGPRRLRPAATTRSILDQPAAQCQVDTVVIAVMENRSFDHYLGWLADDQAYLDAGRSRHGRSFHVDGQVHQRFLDAQGQSVSTRAASSYDPEQVETRGCTFRAPAHNWNASRVQRDQGFLAAGSGNDEFALTYYEASDLPIYAALARRFTVFDRWHASLLGPTFPNRQYLLSAQSEGRTADPRPSREGIYSADTIVDHLARANVPVGYYHSNVALLALWGADRMAPYIHSLDQYFADAAAGQLPRVVFIEPEFGGGEALRTDDHPRGDIGLGQRWVREVLRAFVESPHWARGAFVVTYDEHGGFFDHVAPPEFQDARASTHDRRNFGQGGFRVPTFLASPYARRGGVDHRRYDHTALLRFLEWRFLGAPAEGPGRRAPWALTLRDRTAANMGLTLRTSNPDPELGFDLAMTLPVPSVPCTPSQAVARPVDRDQDPFASPTLHDLETRFPGATYKPWLADVPFAR